MLKLFKNYIAEHDLFTAKDKLLLAVSGGVDSVVLCELCKQAGYEFTIAHCNFKLRGDESERDAAFVKQLAAGYKVEFLIKEFDTNTYAKNNKLSIQEAARELRYEWFLSLLNSQESGVGSPDSELPASDSRTPDYLLTAHHADDNVETVLMNFFKGTGIAGLRGMLPKQGKIVRPLLFASRGDILAFAEQHKLSWVEDSSNESEKYSRNYFRKQVIPLIEKIYPEAIHNLSDNIERFRDIETLYKQSISLHKKGLLEQKGNEVHIPVLKLKKSTPLNSIVYEIIHDFNFSAQQVTDVIALLEAGSGKYVQSSTHRIIRNRNWLIIAPNKSEEAETILVEKGTNNIQCSIFNIQFSMIENDKNIQLASGNNGTVMVEADDIHFPLILRKWKQGDYFYPLGMKKKKKLARFFIDQKLSKTDKEKVWVIESDKKIIWVLGHRIDERFKITPSTKTILKLSLSSRQTE